MKTDTEKQCPLCEEHVPQKSKRCRHCGAVFIRSGGEGPGLEPAEFSDVKDLGLAGILSVVGAIVGFLLGHPLAPGGQALLVGAGALFGLALGTGLGQQRDGPEKA